ncbi:MAG: hypothetical protein IJ779_10280 [Ruminococcus sp.]|nr:hypothetical protein [Ruminococcus sp.]
MSYITTTVQILRSYPTYQFYAAADSKSVGTDDVFRICILETLRWLRSRLRNIEDLPQELNTPEPQDYADFSEESLTSFSYENGFQIDVIYIDSIGAWSFRMDEPDMGANHGTPNERPAVNGRSFITEIAFLKGDSSVEIGIRTICSEPSETTASCEVFRPRVMKALAENKLLRLFHSGCIIDGEPLNISSKTELERFLSVLNDNSRGLPIVLVADSGTEEQKSADDIMNSVAQNAEKYSFSGFTHPSTELNVTLDKEALNIKNSFAVKEKKKKPKEKTPAPAKAAPVKTKLPVFEYSELAERLTGFAIVAFADEKYFAQIENKAHFSVKHGDIMVIPHQEPTERYCYSQYSGDMHSFFYTLRGSVIEMQKRSLYSFGNVLFYSNAKLKEYHSQRHRTSSLAEKCNIYQLENAELKEQIKELSQQQTDMRQSAEALRIARKKIDDLSREIEAKDIAYSNLAAESAAKQDAYRKSAELVKFYQQMIETAAKFPTEKNDICKWIDENYSEDIFTAPRAQSEMRKYSGSLDITSLCDGIVYLSAYAKYRRQEMDEDTLSLYAERCHWEIQGCGKETLKMYRSDYTVNIDGTPYIMDQHIKHGIHSEELIRIYFRWDEERGKILIGSMPEHLPTVKNGT